MFSHNSCLLYTSPLTLDYHSYDSDGNQTAIPITYNTGDKVIYDYKWSPTGLLSLIHIFMAAFAAQVADDGFSKLQIFLQQLIDWGVNAGGRIIGYNTWRHIQTSICSGL